MLSKIVDARRQACKYLELSWVPADVIRVSCYPGAPPGVMYVQHQRPNLPPPHLPRVQQSTLNPRELKASQRYSKTTYPMLGWFGGDEISVRSTQRTQPSCSLFVFIANMDGLKCYHHADLKWPQNAVSALSCLVLSVAAGVLQSTCIKILK